MADDWRWTPLAAICDRVSVGHVGLTSEFFCGQDEGVPLLRSQNVRPGRLDLANVRYVTQEFHQKSRKSQLESGDILFVRVGQNRGDCCVVPAGLRDLNCANIVFARPRRSFSRFLGYYFQSPVGQQALQSISTGSAQGVLNTKSIASIEVPLPPIIEAEAIAHILGTLDDKIELNLRMNETLEAMARALFKSWFVDFDPVRAKAEGRNPGLPKSLADLFPDSYGDSELGEIPKGWQVKALNNMLSELETGGRPKGGVSGYAIGTPSVGAESIVGLGVFDYSKTKYVPDEFFKKMTKGHIKSRDVLLYKDGGRPGAFEPHVTLFGDGFPFETCSINEHVYRMRVKQEIGQNFLFFWLSSNAVMEEMRIKGTGVAIPGLNSTQVKSLTMLVPTIRVAKAFDALVDLWITRILANCNESRILSAVRDTLLPKLISGELRVTGAERIVGIV